MTAKHSRHVALTAAHATYIDDAVATGSHASASDVVRAALRPQIAQEGRRTRRVGTDPRPTSDGRAS